MAGVWENVPRLRLMETIVILWTLNEVPGGSEVHQNPRASAEYSRTRQLTFDREKGLVEILAFLSGTTDDPAKVMAVCVEESPTGDGLTIRLASNSGDFSHVLDGFKRIAKIIEQSSRREKDIEACQHDLLREIVRLAVWRILSRLRSKHALASRKTAGKPSLILQLSEAVNSPVRRKGKKLSVEKIRSLKDKVQHAESLVAQLEGLSEVFDGSREVQDILMNLVMCFSELASDETLSGLLDKVIDLDLKLELKCHLKSAVGKLGRYYSASKELIIAARSKRCSLFDRISVEECRLPPPPATYLLGSVSTLENSISDLINREKVLQRRMSVSIQRYLGKFYLSKSKDFQFRISNPSNSWKVHAEIQLLFFYELFAVDLPPRVICASKNPCYLCHLYFSLHARYHVPDTHGRLYTAWILPTWLEQLSDERQADACRTIDALHTRLVHRIQELAMKGPVPFMHPNESVLWAPANWSASSLISDATKSHCQDETAVETVQETKAMSKPPDGYGFSEKHQGSPSSSSQNQVVVSATTDSLPACNQPEPEAPSPAISEPEALAAATIFHSLSPGETVNVQLLHSKMKLRISTRRLNLNFTGRPSFDEVVPQKCWIRCSMLDSSALLRIGKRHEPVDAESIAPGSELSFEDGSIDSTNDLLIIACDEALSIKYSTEERIPP